MQLHIDNYMQYFTLPTILYIMLGHTVKVLKIGLISRPHLIEEGYSPIVWKYKYFVVIHKKM